MDVALLVLSIGFLVAGHYFKMHRWAQFIEIYEPPYKRNLLRSLSVGYLINFILPFRVGDLVRAIYSGRKMKNGVSFSISTIILDRYLDVIFVGATFAVFWGFGLADTDAGLLDSIKFYVALALTLLAATFIVFAFSKSVKKIIKWGCSVFNRSIEYKLLFFSWSLISSYKDMLTKIKPLKLLYYTFLMWGCYLFSYYLFSRSVTMMGVRYSIVDIFAMLFSRNSFDLSTGFIGIGEETVFTLFPYVFAVYMILPLVILLLISWLPKSLSLRLPGSNAQGANKSYMNLLPHLEEKDRLNFLEAYFKGDFGKTENGESLFAKYLEMNRNIHIVQDCTGGSNATTILCMQETEMFYRKYAIGEEAAKLQEQIRWLSKHEARLPLPKIIRQQCESDLCYYDMPYHIRAVDMFQYAHSMPLPASWGLIERILDCLRHNLYTPPGISENPDSLKKYIKEKALDNLNAIGNAKAISDLWKYEVIYINNRPYRNIGQMKQYLTLEHLLGVFSEDPCSDIHGDLTIENIVCLRQQADEEDDFYIIDPNTGNIHESLFLDYAKLLQSVHGGYEFMMKTKEVAQHENHIDFLDVRSTVYTALYEQFVAYMYKHYTQKQVKSVFYHEIVHWLRLMPYKIANDAGRCLIFYAGLVMVTNDVIEMFEGEKAA